MADKGSETGRMVKYKKETIPIKSLYWDPMNVRQVEPLDDLVQSIKKTGQKSPIIVRPRNKKTYYVTNGWERVQAVARAGLKNVDCHIFTNTVDALIEVERDSIQRPWETYQKINHIRNFYNILTNDQNLTDEKALQFIVKNTSTKTVNRAKNFVEISKLPSLIFSLLKPKDHITEQEWNELEKYSLTVRRKKKVLKPRHVGYIAKFLIFTNTKRKIQTAIEMLSMDNKCFKAFVLEVQGKPSKLPSEIAADFHYGKGGVGIEHIRPGSLDVPKEVKKNIKKECVRRRITIHELIEELLITHFSFSK